MSNILADYQIDGEIDVQFGIVYQGEPMSGGLNATEITINSSSYTSSELEEE